MGAYIPPSCSYEEIIARMEKDATRTRMSTILLGDWNCEKNKHGMDSDRWIQMEEFLQYHRMINLQNCFMKGKRVGTWCHPRWKTWSTPDHLWIQNRN